MASLELARSEVDALCADGRIRGALALAEATLAATDAREGSALVRLSTIRTVLLVFLVDYERALATTALALASAEGVGTATLAHALVDRHLIVVRREPGARGLLERALAVADEPHARCRAACALARLALGTGDAKAAEAAIQLAAESVSGPDDALDLALARLEQAIYAGATADTEAVARSALAAARWPHQRGIVLNLVAQVAMIRRQTATALAAVDEALAAFARVDEGTTLALEAWNTRGELQRALGDLEGARASYEHVRDGFGAETYGRWVGAMNLALTDVALGRLDEATRNLPPPHARDGRSDGRATRDLVAAVVAAHVGDGVAFDAAFRPFLAGAAPGGWALEDFAFLGAKASELAERRRTADWLVRAVRARRLALEQALRLGRSADARGHERALRRLQDRGAPVPLRAFLLHRRIGQGRYGEVWDASHPAGARVAIKIVGDRDGPDDLATELRAVAGLDHPNVVRLLDAGAIEPAAVAMAGFRPGARWIATELATGTAAERSGRLPWAELHAVLMDLLDALAHAHARGLLHLDVKPGNVLLVPGDARPVAKLADFGLAAALAGPATEAGTGTAPYMAPELLEAPVDAGPWTDLYALGCTAFELVTRRPPFVGATTEEVKEAHRRLRPRLEGLAGTQEGFRAWVARLLEKRPADRFRSAAEAARALAPLGPARSPAPTGVRGEILEAGLGLFPLRVPPLVGRERELAVLDAALVEVAARGTGLTIAVRGPRGAGATTLVRAFAERAAVRGDGTPVVVGGPADPGPALIVVPLHPEDPVPPGARVLDLAPPPDLAAVLLARLPLSRGLAERLAAHLGRSARLAVQLLAELVARDALVPAPEGYVLRSDEIRLPETAAELWRERVRTVSRGLPPEHRAGLWADPPAGPAAEALLAAGLAERRRGRVEVVDPGVAEALRRSGG